MRTDVSTTARKPHRLAVKVFNLPNQLTTLRLILSAVLFGLIHYEYYLTGMAMFIVAAGTDWLDGYYARKYGQITTLGRILDPFADKVIICGTFIFLAVTDGMLKEQWGVKAWMVVVIVGRELLVTALRSFLEDRGSDFSAKLSGKLKMVFQCVGAGACLLYLAYLAGGDKPPFWCWIIMVVSVWGAVVLTVYSGVIYVLVAIRLLKGEE